MSRAELRRIYRRVPKIECQGLCSESCGPIMLTAVERDRIEAVLGRELGKVDPETMACPALDDDGRCEAYGSRPLICRLWGVTEGMECPYGCEPERYLSADEADALVEEINRLAPVVCTIAGVEEFEAPYAQWSKVRHVSERKGERLFVVYRDGREQQVPREDHERVRREWYDYQRTATEDLLRRFDALAGDDA